MTAARLAGHRALLSGRFIFFFAHPFPYPVLLGRAAAHSSQARPLFRQLALHSIEPQSLQLLAKREFLDLLFTAASGQEPIGNRLSGSVHQMALLLQPIPCFPQRSRYVRLPGSVFRPVPGQRAYICVPVLHDGEKVLPVYAADRLINRRALAFVALQDDEQNSAQGGQLGIDHVVSGGQEGFERTYRHTCDNVLYRTLLHFASKMFP